jgi:cytoskeletal protein CcmA (bactofilin family)
VAFIKRYPASEKLRYDPLTDAVTLLGEFRGSEPVVGVKKVAFETGAVLLNDAQAFEEVSVGPGCILDGDVSAPRVTLTGSEENPVIVLGNVFASSLEKDGIPSSVEVKGKAFIRGAIVSERVKLSEGAIVYGDVIALKELEVAGPSLILGRAIAGSKEERGVVKVEKATVFQLFSHGDIIIVGGSSTLISPVAVAVEGDVFWSACQRCTLGSFGGETGASVRVLGLRCLLCAETSNPLLCEKHLEGSCETFESLRAYDYMRSEDSRYTLLSWHWRASPAMIVQNLIAKRLIRASRSLPKPAVDSTARTVGGVPAAEYPEKSMESLLLDLRGAVGAYVEAARETAGKVVQEYFESKGVEYARCRHCGMPNPKGAKICMLCGEPPE